ncbi:MAG: HD domain-containing protein [Planctomycetota bacterium]|nr:HD domain-containing protein [Planctomycetota bacterium]
MTSPNREQELLQRIRKLTHIGIMLSKERQLDRLLATIVEESRRFFFCEGGSLFTREGEELKFRIAQNDVLNQNITSENLKGKQISVSAKSIAGFVASSGEILNISDVYEIPEEAPYSFDPSFDTQNDYRTKSVLALPLKDHNDRVLGVLQLINPTRESNIVSFDFVKDDQDLVDSLASQAAIALTNAKLIDNMRDAHVDTIFRLSVAAEYKDEDTASHLERMSRYSAVLSRKMGFDDLFIDQIQLASPMHDVGKIGIPDAILMKPGKLTDKEFDIMRTHPQIGARILGGSSSPLLKMAEVIALSHHEKWNGMGYPNKLKGEEIPIEGRIVALADVFDALTSRRCYKPAWPLERALNLIKETREEHFDPAVVDAFFESLDQILEIKQRYADEAPKEVDDHETSIRG